jgi:hypothetical protein
MDADKGTPDDLDVRLDWPEGGDAMDGDDMGLVPHADRPSVVTKPAAREDRRRPTEASVTPADKTETGADKTETRRAPRKTSAGVDKQSLDRLEQAVVGLADDQARLTSSSLERVESAVAALRDERDWQAAVFAQLEEVVTALGEAEKRNQAALTRLARLEDRLDRVVGALSESQKHPQAAGPPPSELLRELDIRFDELLVALADQLEAPPVSTDRPILHEIQARIDEVVGLLADQPGPAIDDETLDDLHRAVEAIEALEAQPATSAAPASDGVDTQAILDRIDQLAEQVDGLRRRIAVRAKPGTGPGGMDEAILAAITSAVAAQLSDRPARPRKATTTPREPRPGRSAPA